MRHEASSGLVLKGLAILAVMLSVRLQAGL